MKVGCFAGGGSHGAFQVGVFSQLVNKQQLNFDRVYGTSTGNLSAIALAFGPDQFIGFQELESLYLGIKQDSDIFGPSFSIGVPVVDDIIGTLVDAWNLSMNKWAGLHTSAPLMAKIKAIANCKPNMPVTSCRTSLETMEKQFVTAQMDGTFTVNSDRSGLVSYGPSWMPEYQKAVLASASVPLECDAVEGEWVDGGLRDMIPVDAALASNPGEMVVILCDAYETFSPWGTGPRNVLGSAMRSIQMLCYDQAIRSVETAKEECKERGIKLTIYAPPIGIDLGDSAKFEPAKIRELIVLGQNALPIYET